MTEALASLTYSTIVSCDSVQMILMIAASSCDIQNAHLRVPSREKKDFRTGPELGADQGKTGMRRRPLYGLKASGAAS